MKTPIIGVLTILALQGSLNALEPVDNLVISLNLGMSSLNNDYSSVYMTSITTQVRLVDGFYVVGTIGKGDKQGDSYLSYDYPLYTDTGLQVTYGEAGIAYRLWERERPAYIAIATTYRKAIEVDNEDSVISDTYFDGPRAQIELGFYVTEHMGFVCQTGFSPGSGLDVTGGIQFRY